MNTSGSMPTSRASRHTLFVAVAFCLFWTPVIVFAALANEILERTPVRADTIIIDYLHSLHTPLLNNIFLLITSLGNPLSIVGFSLVIFGLLVLMRRFRYAGTLVAGVGGAALANVILKLIFARVRPHLFPSLIPESGYSFPSGHAMVTGALMFTLILLAWRTRWRVPVLIVGLVVAVAVGVSRVYIGVHYPTDILAGWSVAAVWVMLTSSLILDFPFRLHTRISRLLKNSA